MEDHLPDLENWKSTNETVLVGAPAAKRRCVPVAVPVAIEVYEHNGSGWVFSYFTSLRLTLWHLDPLRASAFVPLPCWIQDKRAVINVVGTGEDCFKWAVSAGMHPVDKCSRNPNRTSGYQEHVGKYDFFSLRFPVALSSIGSFATKNDLSINVYGVEINVYGVEINVYGVEINVYGVEINVYGVEKGDYVEYCWHAQRTKC